MKDLPSNRARAAAANFWERTPESLRERWTLSKAFEDFASEANHCWLGMYLEQVNLRGAADEELRRAKKTIKRLSKSRSCD